MNRATSAARQQYHRLREFRAFDGQQVAADAQAGRARRCPCSLLFHPETPANVAFWREAEAATPKVGINLVAAGVHDAGEVERAITAVAAQPNGGLVVYPHAVTEVHLRLIIELAGKYRLPAVYPFRYHAEAGGLLSYGVDALDLVPRAADYVDRIMRGANPGELPVQAPTKFELVINLKTAKALGLTISPTLLARADEVIE
jgi:putative ABC transport system substrate-binding protein